MTEFKNLDQPDFDRERDGALSNILIDIVTASTPTGSLMKTARRSYNEGFKACLRFIESKYYNPDIPEEVFEAIAEEVDKIDKEGT